MLRMFFALSLLLAVAGCKKGDGVVVVNVDAVPALAGVSSLAVHATVGANVKDLSVPIAGAPVSIPPARSFGIIVSQDLGDTIVIHVQALDASNSPVGPAGEVSASIRGGERTDVALTLGQSTLDGGGPDGTLPVDCPSDGGTVLPPRLLSPLSTEQVTSQRPNLRWNLNGGSKGVVDLCGDRACTVVLQSFASPVGDQAQPATPLPPGPVFWRVRSCSSGGPASSPTWELFVGAKSAAVDTHYGSVLDVNGDGIADLAVGSSCAKPNGTTCGPGKVFVYLGARSGFGTAAPLELVGQDGDGAGFGSAIASAGDVNGDGFGDLIVGVPGASPPGRPSAGKAYVYFGGEQGVANTPAPVPLLGPDPTNSYFGTSVAFAGDVDGDGFGDLWVGAPNAPVGVITNVVRVHVFRGGAPPTVLQSLDGGAQNDGFGTSLTGSCDFNGDTKPDLVVGAPQALSSTSGTAIMHLGAVYLFTASGNKLALTDTRLAPSGGGSTLAASGFGKAVACAGDLTGDGFADLVVGQMDSSVFGYNAGAAYVYYGSAGMVSQFVQGLSGPGPGDTTNWAIAVVGGDVNGDGFADFVGSGNPSGGGTMPYGGSRVYYGKSSIDNNMGVTDFLYGGHVAVGDVNGDGFADIFFSGRYESMRKIHMIPGKSGTVANVESQFFDERDGDSKFGDVLSAGAPSNPPQ
jgi:hypothetical protein